MKYTVNLYPIYGGYYTYPYDVEISSSDTADIISAAAAKAVKNNDAAMYIKADEADDCQDLMDDVYLYLDLSEYDCDNVYIRCDVLSIKEA